MGYSYYLDQYNNPVYEFPQKGKTITLNVQYYNSLDSDGIELKTKDDRDGQTVIEKTTNPDVRIPTPASADTSLKKLLNLNNSEIQRFKDNLINKSLQDLDYDLSQPSTPIGSPLLSHLASANNMRAGRETREILMSKANAEYMKTDVQIKLQELELKKYDNSMTEAALHLQAEHLAFSQKMLESSERLNMNLGELRGSLASIKQHLQKMSDVATGQKAVNEKLLEKLNQETAKDITYNGQTYTKTEIEKLGAVENLKGAKDENEFNLNEALELVEDFFSDGFDIETNPIEILINSLKDSLKTEFNEINIKYNLGMESLK